MGVLAKVKGSDLNVAELGLVRGDAWERGPESVAAQHYRQSSATAKQRRNSDVGLSLREAWKNLATRKLRSCSSVCHWLDRAIPAATDLA